MNKSIFIVYDNGGETFDRYTIFKRGDTSPSDSQGNRGCVGTCATGGGFFQHSSGQMGPHLGVRVDFHDLNPGLKKMIINNY